MVDHAGLARDHISCQELVELATEYLEGALADEELALFEAHLNFCEGCVSYLDQMRLTIGATGTLREEDVPAEARERLLGAFRGWRRP